MVLTLSVALILFWAFPMEGIVLRQFIVVMICNPIVNMHTVLLTQYKYRDIMRYMYVAYKIELFSIILWIWIPIQSIIIYTAKNRLQRLLYILPFYILSFFCMRVWQMFF